MKRFVQIISVCLICLCWSCTKNSLPSPDFTIIPNEGNLRTVFHFDASATADLESQLVAMQFRWDWTSDGIWDTDFLNSPFSSYRYGEYGTYKVTLEVMDGFGERATISYEIAIKQQDSIQDLRDGQWYPITRIGGQLWMAKNLNYGTQIDSYEEQTDNQISEKYCFQHYQGQRNTCEKYGGLYQWNEAMQYTKKEGTQGICPPGWHVPSDNDWQVLMDNFHNKRMSGGYRIVDSPFYPDTSMIHDEYEAFGAGKYLMGKESSSGFNGIFSGYRNPAGEFASYHYYWIWPVTSWWSSTWKPPYAYRCGMMENFNNPERFPDNINFGFYIRCLKNNE
ncbi:MAG: hypothetical protein J7L96_07065 [Bacteroidales bacterium]|nr:hypothetical protein [Bacteroidales bacterium]